jgi:two-component system phosphate regulon sensor histidine kinase PhoR
MFWRIFGAYLAILVAGLGGLAVAVALLTRRHMMDEIERRLRSEAHLAQWALNQPDPDAALKAKADASDTRLTLIAPDGSVIADSVGRPASMQNQNARPEVVQARAAGVGRHLQRSESEDADVLSVAVAAPDGTVLRAARPLTAIDGQLSRLYAWTAGIFAGVLLLAARLGYGLVRRIVRPVREMTSLAQAVSQGDFSRRAPLETPPDLAVLARALDAMSDELRRRLDELRAEAARVQAVLASMTEGVIALGADGRVQTTNEAACTLLGCAAPGIGVELWQIVRDNDLIAAAHEALAGRTTHAVLDRSGRVLDVAAAPIGSGGAILVIRDVTEQQRYDELRKEFVANVSHELRTPLTLIRGFAETLKAGALTEPDKAREFLDTIERHALQLSALVENLLTLSRLESAAVGVQRRRTRVDELLGRVRDVFAPAAARKRIALTLDAAPLEANIDPDMIERAVGNLVDNALKYTPDGGSVSLAARAPCVIDVRDTGIGVPEADQARIFERFYRVDKSRSRDQGGTGLGLSIVKHIVQLHGGRVTLESAPGRGSRFRMEL